MSHKLTTKIGSVSNAVLLPYSDWMKHGVSIDDGASISGDGAH